MLLAVKSGCVRGESAALITTSCCLSGELHVELTAKRTVLLVGDTITVNCLARGPEILDDHWKYPGKVVRTLVISRSTIPPDHGQVTFQLPISPSISQANRAVKTVHDNKKDQETLYTLTVPQASVKDTGIYSCSITDIFNNNSQTKQIAIWVYGAWKLPSRPSVFLVLTHQKLINLFVFDSERVHVHPAGVQGVRVGRAGRGLRVQGLRRLLPKRSGHLAEGRRPAQRRDGGDLHQPAAAQRDQVRRPGGTGF